MPASAKNTIRKQLGEAIAARLQKMREVPDDDDIRQEDLAEEVGLNQSKVSQLLRGDTTHFSIDRLIDIAERIDLNVRMTVTRPYSAK